MLQLLQRVAKQWKLLRRGELIQLQRKEENMSIPSLFHKLVKKIQRATRDKNAVKKTKRELVVEAVKESNCDEKLALQIIAKKRYAEEDDLYS